LDQKLNICKNGIAKWKKNIAGTPQQSIYRLKQKRNEVKGRCGEQIGKEALNLQQEINVLMDQEDLKRIQRAKADWLRMGDRNTKFFQSSASQRRKANKICSIKDEKYGSYLHM
jgi:hypothetical protein